MSARVVERMQWSSTVCRSGGRLAVFGSFESPAAVVLAMRLGAGRDGTSWLQPAHVRIMKELAATSACADYEGAGCNERMCGFGALALMRRDSSDLVLRCW